MNIEIVALKHLYLAPTDAAKFMWHTDSRWASPLWWLRALRAELRALASKKADRKESDSRPGCLWYCLSGTMLLSLSATLLSGLCMELHGQISTPTDSLAPIHGPDAWTFNQRNAIDLPRAIRTQWQSGQPTTPAGKGIIYALEKTERVSELYLDDAISAGIEHVEFFVGPEVREVVSGRAWGVRAGISCTPVHSSELKLIRVDDFTFLVNHLDCNENENSCSFVGWRPTNDLKYNGDADSIQFPHLLNITSTSGHLSKYSFIAAADGSRTQSPFIDQYSRDENTLYMFDRKMAGEGGDDSNTVGRFEAFLWESSVRLNDPVLANLTSGNYTEPVEILEHRLSDNNFPREFVDFAGIAIQCELAAAIGTAYLDPARRTFSDWKYSRAMSNSELSKLNPHRSISDVKAPRMLALDALKIGMYAPKLYPAESVRSGFNEHAGSTSDEHDTLWIALHQAINSDPMLLDNVPGIHYPALTPKDMQLAMYKLLGESVIQLMADGGIVPWYGDLRTFKKQAYIVAGVVSWKIVLALFSAWALAMLIGALWVVL
jgi:hypothetical protein